MFQLIKFNLTLNELLMIAFRQQRAIFGVYLTAVFIK